MKSTHRFLHAVVLAACALAWAAVAHAQPAAVNDDCRDAQTQSALNTCAETRQRREDATLNRQYAALRAKIAVPRRDALQKAQRAWLAYRDQHCAFVADGYRGGSLAPMARAGCLADATAQRNAVLAGLLEEAGR